MHRINEKKKMEVKPIRMVYKSKIVVNIRPEYLCVALLETILANMFRVIFRQYNYYAYSFEPYQSNIIGFVAMAEKVWPFQNQKSNGHNNKMRLLRSI